MKISVSVSGQSEANAHTFRCCAETESENFDQPTVERLVQAARQCDVIVRSAGHSTLVATGSPAANNVASHSPGQDGGSGGLKRLATEKQVKAIRAMASRQGIQLGSVLSDRFGVSELSELSIGEASSLIDELKNNFAAT